ncbi:ComF family protein [Pelomonas sp. CA6]|uniref:ComF family protein n=1 Tax=Pelomonas sp. CA6 TaxID=2907999 RepID=UPI001F4C3091|nr:ComF family protein [Pelomonas sp. CA6]MCH7344366.1 ComF family protein [Pelomonas sp. CA6]
MLGPRPPKVELPTECAVCRRWSAARLCPGCRQRFAAPAPRCQRCALRMPPSAGPVCGHCLTAPPPLQACVAALDYDFPWAALIQRYKFRAGLDLLPLWSLLLDEALQRHTAAGVDVLIPIPLSRERLRERGFNQSLQLARALAQRRQCALAPEGLLRVRHTEQQARLALDQRPANLRHAFAATQDWSGQRVALLDDVMTSGATLHEAARTLRRAGAREVQAWVLARTPD